MLAYFVSDVHLNSMKGNLTYQFLGFLRKIGKEKELTHLFLLGDIFDLWIGSKKIFIKKYEELIQELVILRDRGVEIHYFEGNHDVYLKQYWERELHFFVHERPIYFKLGSLRFQLEHGDLIDRKDYSYLFWKWVIHTRVVRLIVSLIPGRFIYSFCEMLGKKSRQFSGKKKLTLKKLRVKVKKRIQRFIQNRDCDFFIAGHYHVRDDFVFKFGDKRVRALNLGTWLNNKPSALRVTQKRQEFVDI